MNESSSYYTENPQRINRVEHSEALYRYAFCLTRNAVAAENLVQETYTRALAAVRRPSINDVRICLFKLLRNTWINQFRKLGDVIRAAGDEGIADTLIDTGKNSLGGYVDKAEQERVQKAIRMLPTEHRRIILLREYEKLSYRKISEILACPPGTVMSRLARARRRLHILLSNNSNPARASNDGSHR